MILVDGLISTRISENRLYVFDLEYEMRNLES